MHIIIALADHLNENESLIKQHAYIVLQTYWQYASKNVKVVLCGGKINNNETNASRIADIIRYPKKYSINTKAIPKCDLYLEEKPAAICSNVLYALNKVSKKINFCDICEVCAITPDFHFSITTKIIDKISSVYNKFTNGHKFPLFKIISSTSNLIDLKEAESIKSETHCTNKFLSACNSIMNLNNPSNIQKPLADMMNIANRCKPEDGTDSSLSINTAKKSSANANNAYSQNNHAAAIDYY